MVKQLSRHVDRRVWLVVLAVVSVAVWGRGISAGGLGWSDAPLHAMDGVFLHDLITYGGAGPLRDWAFHYYAKLPCLGLVVYYPPFFAAAEAVMFLVFGVSAAVARVTVVMFALVGLGAMYWTTRQLLDEWSGLFAAGVWASLPATVLWSRQVMLEVPTAAMMLLCCGLYLKFRSTRRSGWLAGAGAVLVLAVLTKQWALFLGPVIVIDMLMTLGAKKTFTVTNLVIAAVTTGMIFGYMLFAWRYAQFSNMLVRGDDFSHLLTIRNWTYYLGALPEVLGWPGLAFAVIGLLLLGAVHKAGALRLPILWAGAFYLFASMIAYKEVRYFYLVAPPAAMFVAAGLSFAVKGTPLRRSGQALLVVLICWQFVSGRLTAEPERLAGYERAAELVRAAEPAGAVKLVLVDAIRDGQFVFDLRRVQGYDGRCYVLRGSKLLYSRAARVRWHYTEYVTTTADVIKLIDAYGIRYIVVESGPPDVPDWADYFLPPSRLLREVLADARRFERIATCPISENAPSPWRNVELEVYRNLRPTARTSDRLTIPIPAMGKTLEIPLAETE